MIYDQIVWQVIYSDGCGFCKQTIVLESGCIQQRTKQATIDSIDTPSSSFHAAGRRLTRNQLDLLAAGQCSGVWSWVGVWYTGFHCSFTFLDCFSYVSLLNVIIELAIDEEVGENSTGTSCNAICPSCDARYCLLVDEKVSTDDDRAVMGLAGANG